MNEQGITHQYWLYANLKGYNPQGFFPTGKLSAMLPHLKPNTRQKQFRGLLAAGMLRKVKHGYQLVAYKTVWRSLGLNPRKIVDRKGNDYHVTYKKIIASSYQEFKNILYNYSIETKYKQVVHNKGGKNGQSRPVNLPDKLRIENQPFLRMAYKTLGQYWNVSKMEARRIMLNLEADATYGLHIRPVTLEVCPMQGFAAMRHIEGLHRAGQFKGHYYSDGYIKRRGANEYIWIVEQGKRGESRRIKQGFEWYAAG